MKQILFISIFLFSILSSAEELSYYLPNDVTYDESVPTPAEILGYNIGKWHISPHELVYYTKILGTGSPRIKVQEYARTYEDKSLVIMIITSEKNHQRLDEIKQRHSTLRSIKSNEPVDNFDDLPLVVYIGNSIHGNEPSGSNATLATAYYLAAAQGESIEKILDNTVILLDPCMNPDGLNRFTYWANSHKSKTPITDSIAREHVEAWPGGRTNHYWFDLNRDWLFAQHPESRGRVKLFQEWQPNILTDHHEMGTDATYFFQPGVPTRGHPLTPKKNYALTEKIAQFHASILDKIGSLYFTKQRFDDFYYGKGSSYPDAQGSIGILFEQAGSGGHTQESNHGVVTFPFTIRNQIQTVFSTLDAAQNLRIELLSYKRDFFQEARTLAEEEAVKAYIVGEQDKYRLYHFAQILDRNKIEMYHLTRPVTFDGSEYAPNNAIIVPLKQSQYRLLKSLFEKRTTFEDTVFYDVSTWSLPLAFDLPYSEIKHQAELEHLMGNRYEVIVPKGKVHLPNKDEKVYSYIFTWDKYYAPRAVYRLLEQDIRVKVATQKFTISLSDGTVKEFSYGSILIPMGIQQKSAQDVLKVIRNIVQEDGIDVFTVKTGLSLKGMDLGSGDFAPVEKPKVLMIVGDGVSSYEAGEVWHLLDHRFDIPVVLVDIRDANYLELHKYNTIVMVNGSYNNLSESFNEKLESWVNDGGVIVATRGAISWVSQQKLATIEFKFSASPQQERLPYISKDQNDGSQVTGGAIVSANIDLTHPIAYGYQKQQISLFRSGNMNIHRSKNPYATPLQYTESPLTSGYMSAENQQKLKSTAAVIISGKGRGRTICIADNPNFRAFWFGTNKLFLNAIFFGRIINNGTVEK